MRGAPVVLMLLVMPAVASAQAQDKGSLASTLPLRRDADHVQGPGSWATPALLVGLTGGAWVVWRRFGRRRARGLRDGERSNVQRLASQALTPHASVHAVRWNGEELLLGCTAQQVTLLSRRPAAEGAQSP